MSDQMYGTVLLKAKQITDFIAVNDSPVSLKELSDNLEITKPTILKILRTLEYCGFVNRNLDTGKYSLGTVYLRYGQKVAENFDIKELTRPYLEKLCDETNETINLGIVEKNKVVLLNKIESSRSVKLVSTIGGTMEMYSSAMGKAFLAYYTPEKLTNYLQKNVLKSLTKNTITDPIKLQENLKIIKKNGFSIDDIENQIDIFCVGFILRKNAKSYGAFSISAPQYRVDEEVLQRFIKYGREAQQNILEILG
ncbi:MAG: IclR family transcriptional regulator [Liquorilactobacillus nagelii]|jgi:DNA-binding IclR family transcriptional regulator|uniref:IclR family transcriptional regulator n=1 Tax=Liquorilactobacillus nagelii TaxID=82688 RepID=UPI00242ACD6D|nr:IclR family transcriptional regulator [Liquorilactobacillus nagelii]MCI1977592.1 IclR family transcriptional regulator [Liquorilactobacillus nagelii]